MIRIDIFDFLKETSNQNFKSKNFEEIKKDLEELYEYDIVFEELEKSRFFKESSMHIKNNDFIQTRLLISEIKDKKEITEMLNSLGYNVGLLRASILRQDKEKIAKDIAKIMKNNYYGINSIINELNSLKNKLYQLESLQINLLDSELSLDVKAIMEQEFRKKHKKLDEIHIKQKNILLNLSSIFLKLTKKSVFKKR